MFDLKKVLIAGAITSIFALGFGLLFVPSFVAARHSPMLVHTRAPNIVFSTTPAGQQMVDVHLSVMNASTMSFDTPLCVREVVGKKSMHVGCLSVHFDPSGERQVYAFSVPKMSGIKGKHVLIFSYRTPEGKWHEVLNTEHRLMRATYTVR